MLRNIANNNLRLFIRNLAKEQNSLRRISLRASSSSSCFLQNQQILLAWKENHARGLPQQSLQCRTCSSGSPVPVAYYDEVKDLPRHPEKLLIDVREPQELAETGKIPTSINIPLGEVENELKMAGDAKKFNSKYNREKPGANTEMIFHCRSGIRSEKAAQAAVRLGYKNVKNYKGSWLEWADREGLKK